MGSNKIIEYTNHSIIDFIETTQHHVLDENVETKKLFLLTY